MTAAATTVDEVLALADDALVAAQRLAQWCACAPELEEDIALANIALDQLGAARLLLTYAAELEGRGRDEDALAFLREDREFRNALLVELPNGDFAVTMAKLLFLAAFQRDRYRQLAGGADQRLAGIGAKSAVESAYHLDHAVLWTLRLGDGTDESHQRMQRAVDDLWPYTYELFHPAEGSALRTPPHGEEPLRGPELVPAQTGAPRACALRAGWLATVEPVLAQATLTRPADGGWEPRGGRAGRHTEHLSYLLAEMQVVHRAHVGAQW